MQSWAASLAVPLFTSEDGAEACLYTDEAVLARAPAGLLSAVHLELMQACEGPAAGAVARWHYIVATDVLPEQEDDFNRWYAQEHLPGLAAVPGVARAARYRVVCGGGPRYHACYDLVDRSAFNGPAWLAVRGTPWSSRVRPAFTNTRRTMHRLNEAGV